MKIKNTKRWSKPGAEPYLVGLAGFSIAFLARFALGTLLEQHLPMLFFAINCCVIAFFYGFWPSIWFLLLSSVTALFAFTKPYFSLTGLDSADIYILLTYIVIITLVAVLFEWLRREQYRATLLARVSDSRFRLLVEADEERRAMLVPARESAN